MECKSTIWTKNKDINLNSLVSVGKDNYTFDKFRYTL